MNAANTENNQEITMPIINHYGYSSRGYCRKCPVVYIGLANNPLPNTAEKVDTNNVENKEENPKSFGLIYNIATPNNAIILSDNAIEFGNNGTLENIEHTANSKDITIINNGIYQISYSVFITAGTNSTIALAINGVVDDSTSVPSSVVPGEISGTTILSLNAGDIITLVNSSSFPFTQALSPTIGARLSLVKLN